MALGRPRTPGTTEINEITQLREVARLLGAERVAWAEDFQRWRADRYVTSDRQAIAKADVDHAAQITLLEAELVIAQWRLQHADQP